MSPFVPARSPERVDTSHSFELAVETSILVATAFASLHQEIVREDPDELIHAQQVRQYLSIASTLGTLSHRGITWSLLPQNFFRTIDFLWQLELALAQNNLSEPSDINVSTELVPLDQREEIVHHIPEMVKQLLSQNPVYANIYYEMHRPDSVFQTQNDTAVNCSEPSATNE